MTLRTRLFILAALPILPAIVFGIVSLVTTRQANEALHKALLAQEINRGLFELSTYTGLYLQNRNDRNRELWLERHRRLGEMLRTSSWRTPGERLVITRLRVRHRDTAQLFARLVADQASDPRDAGAVARETRQTHQLLNDANIMVSHAFFLQRVSQEEVQLIQRRAALAIGTAQGLIVIVVLIFAGLLIRSMRRPLAALQRGAEVVAEGNLQHQVEVIGEDEVASVARAFNAMTVRLNDYYLALQQEVNERKAAEAALARHRDELEATVAERTAELQREVEARRSAQQRTEKVNAMLTALRSIDQLITSERRRPNLLDSACRILVNECGYHAAWIALTDAAGALTASSHDGLQAPQFPDVDDLRRAWPCQCAAEVLRQDRLLLRQADDPACADCALNVHRQGRMSMIVRLQQGDDIYGLLAVVTGDAFVADEEAQGLFRELASDLALALRGLALQQQRDEAEAELKLHLKELARSNAELQQFAYVASHDLQEPLRGIAGCIELLEHRYHDRLDDFGHNLVDHTVAGARRMRALITDLLLYSRVGTREQTFAQVDVAKVIADVRHDLQVTIVESGATFEVGPMPTVLADETQLSQLFQNLIGNAIKFRGQAPPLVRLAAREEADVWHFTVADNGIGIDPKYFDRIFVVFQRLHTRAEYPGTGMGLSICKKIVERHGGSIWVESEVGAGATLHFTLAKAPASATAHD